MPKQRGILATHSTGRLVIILPLSKTLENDGDAKAFIERVKALWDATEQWVWMAVSVLPQGGPSEVTRNTGVAIDTTTTMS